MPDSRLSNPPLDAIEIHGVTRGAFILRAALATGTVYGAGAVGPMVGRALAQGPKGDIEILNFALTLEYLETAFYQKGIQLGLSGDVQKLATEFGKHESQHVDTITQTVKTLGGKPANKPEFDFPIQDQQSFLTLAVTLEDTGVSAYNGAGPKLKSKEVAAAAGSIVQIEARHASALRLAAQIDPLPDAFDRSFTMKQALDAAAPLIR